MYLYMYKYDLCVGLQLLVFKVHIRPNFGRYKYLYRTIFLSQRNYMSRRTSCSLIFLLTLFSRTPFLRSISYGGLRLTIQPIKTSILNYKASVIVNYLCSLDYASAPHPCISCKCQWSIARQTLWLLFRKSLRLWFQQ